MAESEEPVVAPPLRPPLANTSAPRDLEPDQKDIDAFQKWQEERIQRKLRGEYESQARRLGEVISDSLETRQRIFSVRVEGAPHTRSSFIGSILKPHLTSPDVPPTLEGVLHQVRGITETLNRTDIFAAVEPTLERSTATLAKDHDVDVVFKCKERGRFFLKTSTDVGNGEGSATATARIRNAFGGAESVEGNMSFGTKTRKAYQVRLEAPLSSSLLMRGDISIFGLERDNTSYASSKEGLRGLRATITTPSVLGIHSFSYEASIRHISDLIPTASVSIREAAGFSTKSAVSHTLVHDTRDDQTQGTKGFYTKLFNEFAGFGGNASFLKTEAETQFSRSLTPSTTISFASRAGLLYPLSSKSSLYSDRFHLGGPTSVRMFKQNGMGPRDGADALGGDIYWSAGISLITDLPRKPTWRLKPLAFVNAGRLDLLDKNKPLIDSVRESISRPSISAGVGLIYRFDPIRVELNLGLPLVAAKGENWRRGLQVGMGLEFL